MVLSRISFLAAPVAIVLSISPAVADKTEDIRTILELTNAADMANQMATTMLQGLQPLMEQAIAAAEPGVQADQVTQ